MPTALYFFQTEDDTIHEYKVPVGEMFLIHFLSAIGKGEVKASVHDLPKNIKTFFFPSGRVWYKNGNRFVGENQTKYRWAMGNFKRLQAIKEAKEK